MSDDAANGLDDLELAARCARTACDDEAELRFRMRAFCAAPSFSALRRLAAALSRAERLEMAAEAWQYIAQACPRDAEARAAARKAESRLSQREAAEAGKAACGAPAHSPNAENGRPSGVYRSHDQSPAPSHDAPPQGSHPKSRKHL